MLYVKKMQQNNQRTASQQLLSMGYSYSIYVCLSVNTAHVWMAAVERVRQDQGSLYGQGSLKTYQEAPSHQIVHRAFHRLHYATYSKVTGLHFGLSAILTGSVHG